MALSGWFLSSDHRNLYVCGFRPHGELVRYDIKSGLYAPFLGGISAEFVSFSPDGQWVAYVTYPEGILWRSKADGSERLQLTVPPGYPINPRWSTDNKTIYYSAEFGLQDKLFQVSVEGGEPRAMLPEDKDSLSDPDPSPDGRKLVFAKAPLKNFPPKPDTSIYVLDRDTGQVSRLPGSEGMFSPRWSPDGRYIASAAWDSKKMFLYDLKTQHWAEVDRADNMGWQLFSHDGHSLYYICNSSGIASGIVTAGICRLRLSDRHIDQFPLKNFPGTGHTWGVALSLGPDDMPLLLRNSTTYDIYALELEWK
jgi:Tol biopolymer transport system component